MGSHWPPKPTLTLRIGVTGHRPDKLGDDVSEFLQAQIEALLQRMHQQLTRTARENADVYADTAPCLRVISALAEGADRLAASAALRQNCELTAILPFAQDTYLRDFERQASRDEFRALLSSTATTIELDGQYDPPEARNAGYAVAGMTVVRHSDLVLTVWDGSDPRGHGGTAEIISYAVSNDCPVIWFPSQGRSANRYGELMRLLLPDRSVVIGTEQELLPWLVRLLAPPSEQTGGSPLLSLLLHKSEPATRLPIRRYFTEPPPRGGLCRCYDWFQWLMTMRIRRLVEPSEPALKPANTASEADLPRSDDFAVAAIGEWRKQLAVVAATRGFRDDKLEVLATHYAWLDQLSNYYAGLSRSAYLINYTLAAGAVVAAASLTFMGSIVEIVMLLAILGLTGWGMARSWHQRWIGYRDLAEKLRTTRYLRLLASPPVTPQLPPHFGFAQEAAGQTSWLHRAMVRECGLPAIIFSADYLERIRNYLIKSEVSDQIRYHYKNSECMHLLDQRLHVLGLLAFFLALVFACQHLFADIFDVLADGFAPRYLSIVLPAAGAALFGLRNQGEYARVAQRSGQMAAVLRSTCDELEHSAGASADRQKLEAKAQMIAKTMLSETSDWQILFRARPLELPA